MLFLLMEALNEEELSPVTLPIRTQPNIVLSTFGWPKSRTIWPPKREEKISAPIKMFIPCALLKLGSASFILSIYFQFVYGISNEGSLLQIEEKVMAWKLITGLKQSLGLMAEVVVPFGSVEDIWLTPLIGMTKWDLVRPSFRIQFSVIKFSWLPWLLRALTDWYCPELSKISTYVVDKNTVLLEEILLVTICVSLECSGTILLLFEDTLLKSLEELGFTSLSL